MHLYLIRHGQSFVNLKDWKGGNLDAGLTELGQRQAAALARWLPSQLPTFDALYASTMQRGARDRRAPGPNLRRRGALGRPAARDRQQPL